MLGQVGVLLGLLLASGAASSVTYTYDGDTTNAPTFNRPLDDGSALSTVGLAVRYDAFTFSVSVAGDYNFLSTATDWNNVLFLYEGSFDPDEPLVNYVIGNDNFPDLGLSGFNSVNLLLGSTYILVTTGFESTVDNLDFGAFINTITGPGSVITGGTVPEPGTLALLGLGLLSLGLARRKAA